MKIGIILISDGFAGAERVVYELLKEFSKTQESYLFINEEIKKYYEDINNIKVINLGKLFSINKLLWPQRIISIKKIIKKYDLDILNPHLEYSFLATPKRKNNLIIGVLHGGELINKANPLTKKIINNFLRKSTKLISVSKGLILNLPEKYKKKTEIIVNGVDLKTLKPIKSIKQKNNIILFAGKFIEIKGIKEILEVAKQLPQYEFWFAGQGPLNNLIKGKNIKNLGFQKTKDLVKLYNQATICVFPSHREAFGLVGLEAMACEKPVIATPLGFSEYIENEKDGMIIPSKDEKALKEAIVKLMKDKKLRDRLSKNARKKALQYSWGKVAKEYLKMFKEVVNQK